MLVSSGVVWCSLTAEFRRGGAEARAQLPQRRAPQGALHR